MKYLADLGLDASNIEEIEATIDSSIKECVIFFPNIVKSNFNYLKALGINNYKEIFMKHTHMFIYNPDKFKAIFEKYDRADLVRCLEKNGAVIEKL